MSIKRTLKASGLFGIGVVGGIAASVGLHKAANKPHKPRQPLRSVA